MNHHLLYNNAYLKPSNTNPSSCWSSAKPIVTNSLAPNWARRLNNFLAIKLNLNTKWKISTLINNSACLYLFFCKFGHVRFLTLDKMSLLIQEQHKLNFVDNEMVNSYEEEISKTSRVQKMYSTWLSEVINCQMLVTNIDISSNDKICYTFILSGSSPSPVVAHTNITKFSLIKFTW